ncbi:hypothetical protein BDF22DRAFT_773614 [Syncephalis plumigaleata]|nr:hypothetical protein BDF22DRAFT_773614 [Syncephalis plumigaleata]
MKRMNSISTTLSGKERSSLAKRLRNEESRKTAKSTNTETGGRLAQLCHILDKLTSTLDSNTELALKYFQQIRVLLESLARRPPLTVNTEDGRSICNKASELMANTLIATLNTETVDYLEWTYKIACYLAETGKTQVDIPFYGDFIDSFLYRETLFRMLDTLDVVPTRSKYYALRFLHAIWSTIEQMKIIPFNTTLLRAITQMIATSLQSKENITEIDKAWTQASKVLMRLLNNASPSSDNDNDDVVSLDNQQFYTIYKAWRYLYDTIPLAGSNANIPWPSITICNLSSVLLRVLVAICTISPNRFRELYELNWITDVQRWWRWIHKRLLFERTSPTNHTNQFKLIQCFLTATSVWKLYDRNDDKQRCLDSLTRNQFIDILLHSVDSALSICPTFNRVPNTHDNGSANGSMSVDQPHDPIPSLVSFLLCVNGLVNTTGISGNQQRCEQLLSTISKVLNNLLDVNRDSNGDSTNLSALLVALWSVTGHIITQGSHEWASRIIKHHIGVGNIIQHAMHRLQKLLQRPDSIQSFDSWVCRLCLHGLQYNATLLASHGLFQLSLIGITGLPYTTPEGRYTLSILLQLIELLGEKTLLRMKHTRMLVAAVVISAERIEKELCTSSPSSSSSSSSIDLQEYMPYRILLCVLTTLPKQVRDPDWSGELCLFESAAEFIENEQHRSRYQLEERRMCQWPSVIGIPTGSTAQPHEPLSILALFVWLFFHWLSKLPLDANTFSDNQRCSLYGDIDQIRYLSLLALHSWMSDKYSRHLFLQHSSYLVELCNTTEIQWKQGRSFKWALPLQQLYLLFLRDEQFVNVIFGRHLFLHMIRGVLTPLGNDEDVTCEELQLQQKQTLIVELQNDTICQALQKRHEISAYMALFIYSLPSEWPSILLTPLINAKRKDKRIRVSLLEYITHELLIVTSVERNQHYQMLVLLVFQWFGMALAALIPMSVLKQSNQLTSDERQQNYDEYRKRYLERCLDDDSVNLQSNVDPTDRVLFRTDDGSNVITAQRDKLVKASPYFTALFDSDFVESQRKQVDWSHESFVAASTLVHYVEAIYDNPNLQDVLDIIWHEPQSADTLIQTMLLAHKTDLGILEYECINELMNMLMDHRCEDAALAIISITNDYRHFDESPHARLWHSARSVALRYLWLHTPRSGLADMLRHWCGIDAILYDVDVETDIDEHITDLNDHLKWLVRIASTRAASSLWTSPQGFN